MHTLLCITLTAIVAFTANTPAYTTEPSVKLLSVGYFAERFPAPASEYRVSMDGGEDVPAERFPLEEANNMPDKFLILMPGGHAVYQIPISREENHDEMFLMIAPGRKVGEYGPDFWEKADITVTAAVDDNSENILCHVQNDDDSSQASDYCLLNITPLVTVDTDVKVTVEVPTSESRNASLWELWVSPEDDSGRAKGTFDDSGRQRLRQTQQTTEFNTWLTLTSVVGKTGVGKSTVASFLAGNMSMFTVGSSADGTTTVGTDMSPIIPSQDYITVMSNKLQEGDIPFTPDLNDTAVARPVFFLDSEGMSFRGDEFDFITSGPAAIIAKIIVWITTDRIQPKDLLEDIREYLQGLDRISMGEDSGTSTKGYGQFVIVLNKMQNDDKSDEEMLRNLMGYSGDDEDRETIKMLRNKFEGISVVGLPLVHVEEDEEFGFSVLPVRFREGLNKIANKVLLGTETPRYVGVGNQKYEMNSTEAVMIVSMLIDAANQGNIDLTDPCNVIYTIKKEKVIEEINLANDELEIKLASSCENTENGVKCRKCICPFRNILIDATVDKLKQVIDEAVEETQAICKDPSIAVKIGKLEELVTAWENEVGRCDETFIGNDDPDICDISEMVFKAEETRTCRSLFLCDDMTLPNTEISIAVQESIFIATGTTLKSDAPPKAESGSNGENGPPGDVGHDFKLNVTGCTLLPGSETQLVTILPGGDGGDGAPGMIIQPPQPYTECKTIYSSGSIVQHSRRTTCQLPSICLPHVTNCVCFYGGDCDSGTEYEVTYSLFKDVESSCPTDLSTLDGADGGDGGAAGKCQISGLDITCNTGGGVHGKGGDGGEAGYALREIFEELGKITTAYGYWSCCEVTGCNECCNAKEDFVGCSQSKVEYISKGKIKKCEGNVGSPGHSELKGVIDESNQ